MRLAVLLGVVVWGAGCAAVGDDGTVNADASVGEEQALTAGRNDLNATQAKTVLDSLNDHCGDAWCEGDFDFDFTHVQCDFAAQSCMFTVHVTDPGETDAKSDDRTFWRSCKMTKVGTKYADIVEKLKFGSDITDSFFGKVDDCIARVEGSIPSK